VGEGRICMQIEELGMALILFPLDFTNWIYAYVAQTSIKGRNLKFFGKGYFQGYRPIVISSSAVIIIFLVRPNIIGIGFSESFINISVAFILFVQAVYIFFFRPTAIAKGLGWG
jgi:hypothetical protein